MGNIYMQETGFNTSIKDDYDELNAAMVGYNRTARAMTDSIKHGKLRKGRFANSDPDEVVDDGKAKFAMVGVLTKNNGGVDKRCSAVKRGEVWVDEYGMAHGLGAKAKEIRAIEKEQKTQRQFEDLFAGMKL